MSISVLAAALADRYTIDRELGAGGMATVYLARDLKHDRDVAIKVMRPEVSAELAADRFLREIRTTANLQHPHILPLFDSGTVAVDATRGDPAALAELGGGGARPTTHLYYVMPFVEGETLRDKITRERQCDVAESVAIIRQVASALDYAHERGIIHRDIKPENILLSSGHAVVADFGIARAIGAAGSELLTSIGTAIGTPAYMSPEQSAGISELDGRSDCYALASVLFEMLGGEPPHTGATAAAIIAKRLGTTAPSVRILRNTVPTSVDSALQRALQRAPADRFPSATAFVDALRPAPHAAVSATWRRRAVTTLGIALLAAAAWFGTRRGGIDASLDPDVIAVLPFRVGGNDPTIAYLRESMLDLVQARLSSGEGARTVEPRTMLAAWRRAVVTDAEDLSEAASLTLARELGAGRMVLGSAIATPTELTLTATLLRVDDGQQLARETVAGAPDSIAVLVDRLTAALLIRDAGESSDRRAGLSAVPLDALQDYLAGRKAYRRGDSFQAMTLYQRALERDTTFVEAAFSMVATNAWIGTVFETAGIRLIPQVWAMRDRLGARDRAFLLAIPSVGPNYPEPSSYRDIIGQAERAVDLAPDNPETWLLLGQVLSSFGMAASHPEWQPRAAEALERALALDSSFTGAVVVGLYVAMQIDDTAATDRYATLLDERVAAGFRNDAMLLLAARMRGDTSGAMRRRTSPLGLNRTEQFQRAVIIALHSAQFSLPLEDARWAVDLMHQEAATDPERGAARLADLAVRFAAGEDVQPERATVSAYGPDWTATLIQQGLVDGGYEDLAAMPLSADVERDDPIKTSAGTTPLRSTQDCFTGLQRVMTGDTSRTSQTIGRLRSSVDTRRAPDTGAPVSLTDARVCPLLLATLLEAERTTPGAPTPQLDELEQVMAAGPLAFAGTRVSPTALANFTIARLRAAQGNHRAALAAIRRRVEDYFPQYLWSRPAFLRQEGRLAALVGDTTGALRAYDDYLTMRTDPDPPFQAQRDSVVAERAALRPR